MTPASFTRLDHAKKQVTLRLNSLQCLTIGLVIFISLPLLIIIASLFSGQYAHWSHLLDTVFFEYIINSFILMLGVGMGALLLGLPSAWIVTRYDFPMRRVFVWALMLPMAMPAYIVGYTYTGLLDFTGPVQSILRQWTGWSYGDYWFFNIRSLEGAALMLSLVLYPYVYLMARAAFLEQSSSSTDVSQTLGYRNLEGFFRLSLPMARPAIIAGLSLVLMETLADYGTVQYFGVSTFTTGIFRTFFGMGDAMAATQLASVLLVFVFSLVMIERHSRRMKRYYSANGKALHRKRLPATKALIACFICFTPITCGFVIPVLALSFWSLFDAQWSLELLDYARHSLILAASAAVLTLSFALLLCYTKRLYPRYIVRLAVSIAGMGYAIPGLIIAVAIIVVFGWLDHTLIQLFSNPNRLWLSGSIFALLFAYCVRFLAVSINSVESGLNKININLDHAGQLLGLTPLKCLLKIHIPLLRASVLSALLIVFVDVLKELPATMILRPFDFDTLAVKAYELASDERLADAAPPSLMIILVGLLPVILLTRSMPRR